MFDSNITDEFLNNNCFTYPCSSKDTNFSSLGERCNQVNDFDTCFEDLRLSLLVD